MPFGLSNTSASFQSYINKILGKKFNLFVIVYLNNIFIYIKNSDQGHMQAVKWVLYILGKYKRFINLKKCQCYNNAICFLDYIVFAQKVRMKNK